MWQCCCASGLFDEDDGRLDAWHKREWIIDDEANVMEGWDLRNGDVTTKEYVLAWADGRERKAGRSFAAKRYRLNHGFIAA